MDLPGGIEEHTCLLVAGLGGCYFYEIRIDNGFVKMTSVTLSSKYQIALPKAIRTELGLEAGQELAVIAKGSVIELVPVRSMDSARGMLRGADTSQYRDRTDRV